MLICLKPFDENSQDYLPYKAARLAFCGGNRNDTENLLKDVENVVSKWKKKSQFNGKVDEEKMTKEMDSVVDVYDKIINPEAVVWTRMRKDRRKEVAYSIMKDAEKSAWVMGNMGKRASVKKENIAIKVIQLESHGKEFDINLASNKVAKVHLPGKLTDRMKGKCEDCQINSGILAAFKNMEGLMNPDSSENISIKSNIVGVSVAESEGSYILPEGQMVTLTLYHTRRPPTVAPVCVFLNWSLKDGGSEYGVWDTAGCSVANNGSLDHTVCECNHLTNFAILMDFTGEQLSETDESVLSTLSVVFCSLSTMALILTIAIYAVTKSFHDKRNVITLNLAICLLAMNILVQTGLDRVSKRRTALCMTVSVLLQYSVLSSFFWMLLEGVLLYKMVILVFETRRVRLPILYGIAYGIPFVIVPLSSALHPKLLIRNKYCWISSKNGMIWSVLGPISAIIVVNFIIFVMTLRAASKLKKIKNIIESCDEKRTNLL